jgi:hypothetical protein
MKSVILGSSPLNSGVFCLSKNVPLYQEGPLLLITIIPTHYHTCEAESHRKREHHLKLHVTCPVSDPRKLAEQALDSDPVLTPRAALPHYVQQAYD